MGGRSSNASDSPGRSRDEAVAGPRGLVARRRLDPPAGRRSPARPDPEGGRPGDRDGGRRRPRPGRDRPGVARPPPRPGPAGRRVRGPAGFGRLGPGAGTGDGRRDASHRPDHLGDGTVDCRPPRPAPQGDRLAGSRDRMPPGRADRPGRPVAGVDPVAGPVRPAGRRRLLPVPGPSPVGPGADHPPVVVAVPGGRDPGQSHLPDPDHRGGCRPADGLAAGRPDPGRPPGGAPVADVRPAAFNATGRSSGRSRRCRRPRPRGRPGRSRRRGWTSPPLRA